MGAGILGLALARELQRRDPAARITVLDKESRIAVHQTGHNSGVVHAGLYYAPGSLKAQLCTRGRELLRDYCAQHRLPYDERGKLVVARDESELPALRELESRSRANGVPGLRAVEGSEISQLEPNVRGVAALHSPHTAIVDYGAIAAAYAGEIVAGGGAVRLGFEVERIEANGAGVHLAGPQEQLAFDRVVLCAGLQSDRLARLAGDGPAPAIVPFRGEYFRLVRGREGLVRGLVYPVPDPAYPFLGVHFTPRVDGSVDIGPNAVLALAREGYRRRDVRLADLRDLLRAPGLARFARVHWRAGARELRSSLSRRAYLAEARRFVPSLRDADVVRAPAGVRAQALGADGALLDDFQISHLGAVTAIRNAPSPGATSSLAIAEYIADRLG